MRQRSDIYRLGGSRNVALRQGEIITGLIQLQVEIETLLSRNGLVVAPKNHPFAIVLSQDCDLDQDFKARNKGNPTKGIPNILFAEVQTASDLKGSLESSKTWDRIKINKDDRYHFMEIIPAVADRSNEGLPELGIDFKRYFTIPADEVYYRLCHEAKRRSRLISPYVQHLSSRFAHYLSRVGLPRDYDSERVGKIT